MEVSQKTKNETTIEASNFTPGPISERSKNTNLKNIWILMFISSIIYNYQDMDVSQMSISRWMDKEDMVYIYTTEYYSAMKSMK